MASDFKVSSQNLSYTHHENTQTLHQRRSSASDLECKSRVARSLSAASKSHERSQSAAFALIKLPRSNSDSRIAADPSEFREKIRANDLIFQRLQRNLSMNRSSSRAKLELVESHSEESSHSSATASGPVGKSEAHLSDTDSPLSVASDLETMLTLQSPSSSSAATSSTSSPETFDRDMIPSPKPTLDGLLSVDSQSQSFGNHLDRLNDFISNNSAKYRTEEATSPILGKPNGKIRKTISKSEV